LALPFGSQLLYLSWADASGALNLMISADGAAFAEKSIVAETSAGAPAPSESGRMANVANRL